MADDDKEKSAPGDLKDHLVNLLVAQKLKADYNKSKYVAFIDLLGFSDLVKQFPGLLNVEVEGDYEKVSTSTSKSGERFGYFHHILDQLANNYVDTSHPERMMVFSDCAFLVYDNATQAAVSLAWAMRQFLVRAVPVRACLAKGTCHPQRFSIEELGKFNITRSMFYGNGVVFATEGEKKAGKGCRVFLHTSLSGDDLKAVESRIPILALQPPNEYAQHELNYLYEDNDNKPHPGQSSDQDFRLWLNLLALRLEVQEPIPPGVLQHYTDSLLSINRMREQRQRKPFEVPKVTGSD